MDSIVLEEAPKPVKKRKRGRPKKRGRKKKPPIRRCDLYPNSPYKMMAMKEPTHAMLKEMAGLYQVSMSSMVHQLVEVAFKKALAYVEERERLEREKGES